MKRRVSRVAQAPSASFSQCLFPLGQSAQFASHPSSTFLQHRIHTDTGASRGTAAASILTCRPNFQLPHLRQARNFLRRSNLCRFSPFRQFRYFPKTLTKIRANRLWAINDGRSEKTRPADACLLLPDRTTCSRGSPKSNIATQCR